MSSTWEKRAQAGPYGKQRRDWMLMVFVALAIVVALVAVLPVVFSTRLTILHNAFT